MHNLLAHAILVALAACSIRQTATIGYYSFSSQLSFARCAFRDPRGSSATNPQLKRRLLAKTEY